MSTQEETKAALEADHRARYRAVVEKLRETWLGRAETQELPKKGKRRDTLCLEFCIGAAAALDAVGSDIGLSGLAMMASIRGASWLENEALKEAP